MLVDTVLRVLATGAFGAWLGVSAFFSFVGAPRAFDVLDRDHAGRYVNATFPTYYAVTLALGVLGGLAVLGLDARNPVSTWRWVAAGAALVGVVVTAYARFVLVPRMDAAGDDAFERYHGQSVALNGVALLAAALALVAVTV